MARDERTRPTRTGGGFLAPWLSHRDAASPTGGYRRSGFHCVFSAALLSLLFVTQRVGPPTSVVLVVDGVSHRTVTAQRTVAGILAEVGIDLDGGAQVTPPPDAPITPNLRIAIQRFRPLTVALPDRELFYHGVAQTPESVAAGLGVVLGPRDLLRAETIVLRPEADLTPLRAPDAAAPRLLAISPLRLEGVRAAHNPLYFSPLAPVRIAVERAVPVVLHDRGHTFELAVRGANLREALEEVGVPILPGDLVQPDSAAAPRAGLHVYIERAKDVVLAVGGRTQALRSRAARVADLLQERSVTLGTLDQVTPPLAAPLRDGAQVQVVRVREELVIAEVPLPFARQRIPTGDLTLGERRVLQAGLGGLERRFFRVRLEDGQEVARELTATRTPAEPRAEMVEFGTRAPTVMTPAGPQEYYRKLRVWATWYNASHGGKPRDAPGYGITALGLRATRGVMAVDPRVIPFWTRAYVPGYGVAVAADTGGAVRGSIIDLAFDEDEEVNWRTQYADIYLLGTPTLQDALRAAFPDE